MAKRRKTYNDDDGRVVAKMNVEGMPWYVDAAQKKQEQSDKKLDLTKEETKYVIWGALKAGLVIAGIFILGAFLLILFCLYVWFP